MLTQMLTQKITIRTPVAADYTVIAAWVQDAASCARWAGHLMPFPFVAEELPTLLSIVGGQSYCLAEPGCVPYGFGQLQHLESNAGAVHLSRIIVAPSARGQGYGRDLCQQLIARAFQIAGTSAVTLVVDRDNPIAIDLYLGLGFMPVESKSDERVIFMRMEVNQ
jgi:ribosomal protein S18 acetylase RimI-like enzyme